MSYEQGFHDAVLLLKYYLSDAKSVEDVKRLLDYVEAAVLEGKIEQLKKKLGLFL